MIKVKEYRGHIRNWEALCAELNIDKTLSREAREEAILIKAYETWGCQMADHMHGMFAFALLDEDLLPRAKMILLLLTYALWR